MTLLKRIARLWANFPLHVKGLVVVLLPVVALLLCILLISQIEKQKDTAEEWVKHTQDLRAEILNTYIVLVSAESSVRDYALNGHEQALQPYERAKAKVNPFNDIRDVWFSGSTSLRVKSRKTMLQACEVTFSDAAPQRGFC